MSLSSSCTLLLRSSSRISFRSIVTSHTASRSIVSRRNMASQITPESQAISETARAEGGPQKGSTSAQMQSEVGTTRNFEQAAQEIGSKMENTPETVTAKDANYLKSREARATGLNQPPKDSISAEAQRLATANEKGEVPNTGSTGSLSSEEQSRLTKERNFESVASEIGEKMANNPASVTKEDANLLHSREHRAHGQSEKGGIASQAQTLAAENEKTGA